MLDDIDQDVREVTVGRRIARCIVQPVRLGAERTSFDDRSQWIPLPPYRYVSNAQRVHAFDTTTDVDFGC